jgi:hypothetical protein
MNENQLISIKGLCKVTLLHEMWKHQRIAAFYSLYGGQSAPEFNMEEARNAIHNYIDYFCGRAIKVNLSGDVVSSYAYDRDSNKKLKEIINDVYTF